MPEKEANKIAIAIAAIVISILLVSGVFLISSIRYFAAASVPEFLFKETLFAFLLLVISTSVFMYFEILDNRRKQFLFTEIFLSGTAIFLIYSGIKAISKEETLDVTGSTAVQYGIFYILSSLFIMMNVFYIRNREKKKNKKD
jgi:hypothetical protein